MREYKPKCIPRSPVKPDEGNILVENGVETMYFNGDIWEKYDIFRRHK